MVKDIIFRFRVSLTKSLRARLGPKRISVMLDLDSQCGPGLVTTNQNSLTWPPLTLLPHTTTDLNAQFSSNVLGLAERDGSLLQFSLGHRLLTEHHQDTRHARRGGPKLAHLIGRERLTMHSHWSTVAFKNTMVLCPSYGKYLNPVCGRKDFSKTPRVMLIKEMYKKIPIVLGNKET